MFKSNLSSTRRKYCRIIKSKQQIRHPAQIIGKTSKEKKKNKQTSENKKQKFIKKKLTSSPSENFWLRPLSRYIAPPTELQGTCLNMSHNFKFISNKCTAVYQDQLRKENCDFLKNVSSPWTRKKIERSEIINKTIKKQMK